MGRRKFDKESYKKNDWRGKSTVRDYLNKCRVYSFIPQEDYGADVLAYHSKVNMFIRHEAEMKNLWLGDWPEAWDTVSIPEGKKRLLDGTKIYFWVIRGDCKYAWRVDGEHLKEEYIEEVSNTSVANGEKFFRIPTNKCVLVKL